MIFRQRIINSIHNYRWYLRKAVDNSLEGLEYTKHAAEWACFHLESAEEHLVYIKKRKLAIIVRRARNRLIGKGDP